MIRGTLVNLRAREVDDVERMARWVNDREVTRTLLVRYPWSLAAEEAFVRGQTSKPLSFGDTGFAIEVAGDGTHIGSCGLHRASAEARSAELGIMIGEKEYWGRGYGTDAVRTIVRFAFDEMGLNRVMLHCYDFNDRGIAAYRKCGFVEEGRLREAHFTEGRYCDMIVMGVTSDDWRGA